MGRLPEALAANVGAFAEVSGAVPNRWLGACPSCGCEVVWADVPAPGVSEDAASVRRVLLAVGGKHRPPERVPGMVQVVFSAAGRALVVTPDLYELHVCDPARVEVPVSGAYTADVLARPCPVEFCLAIPGSMCVTPRQEVLVRPHGARAAPPEEPGST